MADNSEMDEFELQSQAIRANMDRISRKIL